MRVRLNGEPIIVAAVSPRSSEGQPLGTLNSHVGSDAFPFYYCTDSPALLNSSEHRTMVAADIIGAVRKTFKNAEGFTYCVLIHKDDLRFINAMLGLADELLKHRVDLLVILVDSKGELSERIVSFIEEKKSSVGSMQDQYPLLRNFDRRRTLWELNALRTAAKSQSEG